MSPMIETPLRRYTDIWRQKDPCPGPDEVAAHCDTRDAILRTLETLTYREREVVKLRFGLGHDYPYTLAEIGQIFNVGPERVRQIFNRAIRKLQHPVRREPLRRCAGHTG